MSIMSAIANMMAVTASACKCEKPAPDRLIAIDHYGNRVACQKCLGMIPMKKLDEVV